MHNRASTAVFAVLSLWLGILSTEAVAATDSDRVALVIGNSNYGELPSLPNPRNDAKAMSAVLWEAGFETIEVLDANREEMLAAIATFAKRLQPHTDAVFFYAGHGVQSSGANFLLPTSTSVSHAPDLANHGIDANQIASIMGNSEANINILILDACRDNPFADMGPSLLNDLAEVDRSLLQMTNNLDVVVRSSNGLAPMHTTRSETIVGYSTGPGQVALDGTNQNSPYTTALLQNINVPGLEIDRLFRRVRASVREQTKGRQIPWVASTLENEFYFRPELAEPPINLAAASHQQLNDTRVLGMAPPSKLVEDAFWRVVEGSNSADNYKAYLQRYPEGDHTAAANDRLAKLVADPARPVATPPSPIGPQGKFMAYFGVGPVAADLQDYLPSTRGVIAYQVETVPTSGTFFRADETAVLPGQLLAAAEVRGLTFLPRVGSKSAGLEESLALAPLGSGDNAPSVDIKISSEIHACDLMAGFRYAPDRVWEGVERPILRLDPEPAIEACRQAIEQYPEVDRFKALLSRTYQVSERFNEAFEISTIAAERGYSPSIVQLGYMYLKGYSVPVDYDRALDYFKRGDELAVPAAALRIAEMYEAGWGVPRDIDQALVWYQRSIDLGNAYAKTRIARLYLDGNGVARDPVRAAKLFREAANAGELSAQINLTRMYRNGDGVPQNLDEALVWARAAAGVGFPSGQKNLGQYYESLPGDQRDLEAAVYWLSEADQQGDPWAPVYLGEIYLDDAWPQANPGMAQASFERAIDRGNTDAARQLGKLFGKNGLNDPAKSVLWHRTAAEGGNVWSMRDLGRAMIKGEGTAKDPATGFSWLVRAAEGGNPWAQRDVGMAYLGGDTAGGDASDAARYLAMAMVSDDTEASNAAREQFEQIGEADRVRATQKLLNEIGFANGAPDGVAGSRTNAAIQQAASAFGMQPLPADNAELIGKLARQAAVLNAPQHSAANEADDVD